MTPRPSASIRAIAVSSWGPQSHLSEWNTSPVRQRECTRTMTSSPSPISPLTSATCVSPSMPLSKATGAELAVRGRQPGRRHAPHQRLGPHAGTGSGPAIVIISSLCRFANFVSSGTRAIVPSSFMISQMTPAGYMPGDTARSTGRLGLPRPHEHAAVARAQRRHVARTREIGRLGLRIDRGQDGRRPVGRPRCPSSRAASRRSGRRTPC
jgi:hypothetical protein